MVTFFSGNELIEIAIGIERNGFAFYQKMADTTENEAAKSVFSFLAREEKKHETILSNLGGAEHRFEPSESYPGEHLLYLKSLVDNLVFQNLGQPKEDVRSAKEIEAINTGIQAEKDSILFYTEMAEMVREADRSVVAAIIDEEKEHLKQLSSLKVAMQKEKTS